ncbi:hypothetical protein DFH09DRAFT_1312485 [Mycena vulgaris]|nr:hypothetical protein DFH09DRAFT_1312485 [Mycena vulgaris]
MSNPPDEYNDSDEESLIRPIDYNASRGDIFEALKASQLTVARLLTENRKLRKENADLLASSSKKRRKGAQNEDVLGYKGNIVGLAKRFLLTKALFLDRKAFQKDPPERPDDPRDQFTSNTAYTKSLAIALFQDIPVKFHPLLDSETYSNFSNDFIHEHGEGRSSFVNTLRKTLPTILKDLNVNSDLLTTANADRSKDPVLAGLLKFPNEKKPTRFAPVLFPGPAQNMNELFTGPIFLKVHRLMYFGPGSLAPGAKPAQNSNGIRLAFKEVTSSSISAAGIFTRFVLSPDKEWASKGAISGINWEADYRAYLEQLEYNRHQPHIKKLFKRIHTFVFAGVTLSTNANANESDDETVDTINDLMRRFELGTDTMDEDVPHPDLDSADDATPSAPVAAAQQPDVPGIEEDQLPVARAPSPAPSDAPEMEEELTRRSKRSGKSKARGNEGGATQKLRTRGRRS